MEINGKLINDIKPKNDKKKWNLQNIEKLIIKLFSLHQITNLYFKNGYNAKTEINTEFDVKYYTFDWKFIIFQAISQATSPFIAAFQFNLSNRRWLQLFLITTSLTSASTCQTQSIPLPYLQLYLQMRL